jgi:hypothetical protein
MSLTHDFCLELKKAIQQFMEQYDEHHPMDPKRAKEAQDILTLLHKATSESVINPLTLKQTLTEQLQQLPKGWHPIFTCYFTTISLHRLLKSIMQQRRFATEYLQADYLTELGKCLNASEIATLKDENKTLIEEIQSLRSQVANLNDDNRLLKETMVKQMQRIDELTTKNNHLSNENERLRLAHRGLNDKYLRGLQEVRELRDSGLNTLSTKAKNNVSSFTPVASCSMQQMQTKKNERKSTFMNGIH